MQVKKKLAGQLKKYRGGHNAVVKSATKLGKTVDEYIASMAEEIAALEAKIAR